MLARSTPPVQGRSSLSVPAVMSPERPQTGNDALSSHALSPDGCLEKKFPHPAWTKTCRGCARIRSAQVPQSADVDDRFILRVGRGRRRQDVDNGFRLVHRQLSLFVEDEQRKWARNPRSRRGGDAELVSAGKGGHALVVAGLDEREALGSGRQSRKLGAHQAKLRALGDDDGRCHVSVSRVGAESDEGDGYGYRKDLEGRDLPALQVRT